MTGAAFALAASLVHGFDVASFGSAVAGGLIVSLVSWAFGSLGWQAAASSRRAGNP